MPAKPLTKADKPTAPSKVTVIEPTVAMEDVTNENFTGNRGQSGKNNILQSDAANNQCVILQSVDGNVYVEAGVNFQSECKNRMEDVKGDKVLFTLTHTVHNKGVYDLCIDGATTYNSNADYTLNVVGTHTHKVIDHVFEAQSQKVSVSGAQNIIVGGAQDIHVASRNEVVDGSSNTEVNGPKKYKFGAEMINNVLGDCKWIKASTDRNITIADKEQINIAGEISLNIGVSEKVNIGAHAEQTFGYKNSMTYAACTDIAYGFRKSIDCTTKKEKIAVLRDYATAMNKNAFNVGTLKGTLNKMAAKITMFT